MGVILEDLTREDRTLDCNWWHWRPTIELLRQSGIFDAERLEMMGYNGCAEVSQGEARSIARFLERRVLPTLRPGSGYCSTAAFRTCQTTASYTESRPSSSRTTARARNGCERSRHFARSVAASACYERRAGPHEAATQDL